MRNNYTDIDDKHYFMYLALDDEAREEIDELIENYYNRQYADDLRETEEIYYD